MKKKESLKVRVDKLEKEVAKVVESLRQAGLYKGQYDLGALWSEQHKDVRSDDNVEEGCLKCGMDEEFHRRTGGCYPG